MRLGVKPIRRFYSTFSGGADRPRQRLPAVLAAVCHTSSQHAFPAAALPSPELGGERRRGKHATEAASRARSAADLPACSSSVGVSSVRADARTTVYPCGTRQGPMHPLPYTPLASGTPQSRAHPSNERCLHRFTRRHIGGSLRPRYPAPRQRQSHPWFSLLIPCSRSLLPLW